MPDNLVMNDKQEYYSLNLVIWMINKNIINWISLWMRNRILFIESRYEWETRILFIESRYEWETRILLLNLVKNEKQEYYYWISLWMRNKNIIHWIWMWTVGASYYNLNVILGCTFNPVKKIARSIANAKTSKWLTGTIIIV